MAETEGKDCPIETIESLTKEAESLKKKLEDERQKLNDVTLATVADRLDIINYMNIKPRRTLKGHQAKVLCSDWSPDKRHIVSTSQVIGVLFFQIFTNSPCVGR
jgi:guanine nucleotide-binding protein subunit beta-5